MKVAVIGATGQLGTDLCQKLKSKEVVPLTHSDIEVTDINSVERIFQKYRVDVIINTAAFHKVDECEENPEKAFKVNALGARNVAVVAQKIGAKLVYISTDYVFGGEKGRNIPYNEFDVPSPLNVYGKSKLAGENFVKEFCLKHFIIRTSGLFGIAGARGKGGNFVETIIKLAKEKSELKVVNDQIFSPTYTKDLAEKILQLINTEYYGIFHITNKGFCSWYEFAKKILKLTGIKISVIPITSEEFSQKVKRPNYSVLDNYHLRLLGMDDLKPWQEALKEYLKEKEYIK
ncbi:MAG: dTDP-4-dehydrorhamnose reductase [Candidatus Omnitrophica bacterium]|nr:dTDP-4-dehydrorhamnose reductase [Candidatus Omnitrophota bacterium]